MTKSHVSLEQHVCLVCGTKFETNSLLLDKRMRATLERHTVTGWGLCPEHQKLADDGYVALVECDPSKSGRTVGSKIKNEDAHRTGRIAHVHRSFIEHVFSTPIDLEHKFVFVEPGVIDKLQEMVGCEQTT